MRRDDDSDHRAVDKWRCRSHALQNKMGESHSTEASTPDRSTGTPIQLSPAATRSWRERAELNENSSRYVRHNMAPGDAYRGPVDVDTGGAPSEAGTGASTSIHNSAWSWSIEHGVEVDDLSAVKAAVGRSDDSPTERPESDCPDVKPSTPRLQQPMLDDQSHMGDPNEKMATIDPVEVDELDKIVMSIQDKDYSVEEEASLISSVLSAPSKPKKRKTKSPTPSPKMSPNPSRNASHKLTPSNKDSPPRRTSPSNSQSRPSQSHEAAHLPESLGRGRESPIPRRSPSPMEAAAAALAAADQINTGRKSPVSSHRRRSPSPTDYRTIEASLSDVPSDVDSDTKERYLTACRLLKSTLIQKEKALLPTEKSFLQELLDQDEENLSAFDVAAVETAS